MTTSPTQPKALVTVGDVIAGKFKIERIIGQGGMGIVAAARHLQLDERVALKFLRPEMTTPETVARFAQEARAAVKLKSEHVARVIDVGAREDGLPFIVMEYLRGKNLADLLHESGPLPVEAAVELMIHACEGLAEAHARGIVHRDIKPENLFLVDHGDGWRTLKILDFGISKAALTGSVLGPGLSNVETQSIMGSPCYMSPEQLRSTRSVDHRADLWSIGAVLFELLTGATAYDAELPLTELIANILEQDPPRLSALLPGAPPALEEAIDRCLDADRERRFQNAAELAIALMPFAPKRSRVAVERATSVTRAAGLAPSPLEVPGSVAPPPSESTGPVSIPPQSRPGFSGPPSSRSRSDGASRIGPYRLAASLAHSTLWDAFLALSPAHGDRPVVLKRLRPGLSENADLARVFLEQARRSTALHHECVVETLGAGVHAGTPYVVTELIDGQPLDAIVLEARRAGVRLSPLWAASVLARACAGLRHVHELADETGASRRLLHEQINPRNVFVTYDGLVKLVDVGLARAAFVSPASAALLRETRGYLAPEQGVGTTSDWRVDTFGAGATLWELLTDRRLTRPESDASALQRFAEDAAPLVTDLVTDVDAELGAIAARAVARNPAARYQSARELGAALDAFLAARRDAPADLGAVVRTLFVDARERMARDVDAALVGASASNTATIGSIMPERRRRAASTESGSAPRSVSATSRPPSSRRSGRVGPDAPRSADGAAGGFETVTTSSISTTRDHKHVVWAVLGVLLGSALTVTLLLRAQPPSAVPARPPPGPVAVASASGPDRVVVALPASPSPARPIPTPTDVAAELTAAPTPAVGAAPLASARLLAPATPSPARPAAASSPRSGSSPDLDIRMHR